MNSLELQNLLLWIILFIVVLLVWLRWANFPPSSPHSGVLCICSYKGVPNTRVFWLQLSGAHTASRLSDQHYPLTSKLWLGKILGRDVSKTADPNWLQECSIPYDICSATKSERKEDGAEGWGAFDISEQPLHVLKSCFPGRCWTSSADGK